MNINSETEINLNIDYLIELTKTNLSFLHTKMPDFNTPMEHKTAQETINKAIELLSLNKSVSEDENNTIKEKKPLNEMSEQELLDEFINTISK